MEGFFPTSVLLKRPPASSIPQCEACGLYKMCKSPKLTPKGKGNRKVLIVGISPGGLEDRKGQQLAGSGALLEEAIRDAGYRIDKDAIYTTSIICHDPRKPNPKELAKQVQYCKPNLVKTFDATKPNVVLLLGAQPIKSFIGHIWKEDAKALVDTFAGWTIPCQTPNVWVCPTWSPAQLRKEQRENEGKYQIYEHLFKKHIRNAFSFDDKPWETIPEYKSKINKIRSPREAAVAIRSLIKSGRAAAFDYETNMLKPDSDRARIVSCSISNGKESIAFPWFAEVIDAMWEFIRSPLGKIGSNIKFEERWTMKFFKRGARNWIWDTMLAAHWLDPRDGITSIKFQAFVLLGVPNWSESVDPFLGNKDKESNTPNRIKEVDIGQLLLYNGLDSLIEYLVARKQMKDTGLLERLKGVA